MSSSDSPSSPKNKNFPPTRWSIIVQLQGCPATEAIEILGTLCKAYWYPIYAFLRRSGHSPQDAEDLTQGYFQSLIQRGYINKASEDNGRFRTFLLKDLKFYLGHERDRSQAQKRGGLVQF